MRSGSSAVSAQRPPGVMPIGRTSYAVRSMALRTAPAVTTEIPCSELRPPNTTATRGLRDGCSGLWGRFSVLISRREYLPVVPGYSARNAVREPNGGGRRSASLGLRAARHQFLDGDH